ncbi:16S rRNA (cytosine(967)-C(5))-methyltransferase RsmB [Mannheimia haemolytica]|uniref:16S rRNA (cytosine(967)-C(5))-methyltransferase n=1 Tax=Mannheimia haemolytica TaxID=75985 RepID=A0A249A398_MANHA|nr:16S rRNA (cytosine(967)-C(5))-methyltransferase RsmB [Mannheimia haemolytica USDA-ARS-USMARC-183]AGI34086.1 16S rRNA (cytosine(967)-C(5))-methyltransferase RsmB [Mannheimia haemolytica USDA-ARS-USMARC-185]AGK01087.1 16S rRNA methyltransferase RsmB [Mannheimia haemolytica M42548]AJE06878.1 16S rRNA (cytosine(967)-C(5))-methyltransferase RsmB [Mannheimia haemolytica USDA-ARS-USMARC-184]ASW37636.1 16S rRNA (cytosine(967)-C(5))-methyltransferase RsmB [Mannheimia haemolytica]AWW72657.1 16S rRNA 
MAFLFMKKQSFKALSSRAISATIILQVLDQGKSLSTLIPDAQKQLEPKDLPLVQEITFGVCRVLPRLESIIKLLVEKPLKGKTRLVHCLLLVGLYQLLYMRVPAHAAVDEVVNATKTLKLDSFRALTNGVLRRFLREQEEILAKVDKHWQTLHPEWLVNKLKKAYPNWREIVEANNQRPPMWIRVNQQHIKTNDYAALISELVEPEFAKNSENPTACVPKCALLLERAVNVNQLPHFEQGWATVQDAHAQWSAELLGAENGETVLDACAAPGGKTTHILEKAPKAKVMALDIEESRLSRVRENLVRLGQIAQVICGDASKPEEWLEEGVLFDRILLDAPCSATGVIRRHPDIKWLRKEGDIAELATLQGEILKALWQRLKPNGILLYATCSVLPQENSEQIQRFLQDTPNAKQLEIDFNGEKVLEKQFFPQPNGGDGFFYAKLQKVAE